MGKHPADKRVNNEMSPAATCCRVTDRGQSVVQQISQGWHQLLPDSQCHLLTTVATVSCELLTATVSCQLLHQRRDAHLQLSTHVSATKVQQLMQRKVQQLVCLI